MEPWHAALGLLTLCLAILVVGGLLTLRLLSQFGEQALRSMAAPMLDSQEERKVAMELLVTQLQAARTDATQALQAFNQGIVVREQGLDAALHAKEEQVRAMAIAEMQRMTAEQERVDLARDRQQLDQDRARPTFPPKTKAKTTAPQHEDMAVSG